MHLARTSEHKSKFEIFITHPSDPKDISLMNAQLDGLLQGTGLLCEHTSYSVNGRYGWAFFEISDEEWSPSRRLHPEVYEFIRSQIMNIITRERVTCYQDNVYRDRALVDGCEILENQEVDCFFFQDELEWYR